MLRIQQLKQPKKTSGEIVGAGKSLIIDGIKIKNTNKFPVYVDRYQRKKSEEAPEVAAQEVAPEAPKKKKIK